MNHPGYFGAVLEHFSTQDLGLHHDSVILVRFVELYGVLQDSAFLTIPHAQTYLCA